jgi:hypothetical protein
LCCVPLPIQITNDLFIEVLASLVIKKDDGEDGDFTYLNGAHTFVILDNSINPIHGLLQVTQKTHKGNLYDHLCIQKK